MKKGVSTVLKVLAGGIVGAVATGTAIGRMVEKDGKDSLFNKVLSYYFIYDQWLSLHQRGKTLVEYFEEKGYKTVAIYGLKELGERLYDELKDSGITVKYIIDKNADDLYADVGVVTPDDNLEPVDVIVVTACYYFDQINKMLNERVEYPVVSLEDILYKI
ncbi:MAG: hypothetical protein HFI48_09850 [Lachnospiraceae bacterium]|nr:hypothetical protein [Lachnospiraceae bacterium]